VRIVSADLALAADPSVVDRAADPGEFVIRACERAKTWLREALDCGDIDQIAECKSQAEAVRVYTMSRQLGKDAQVAATEIVRRAERGMGVAIRRGQESGDIWRKGQHRGNQHTGPLGDTEDSTVPRPVTDFATYDELAGNAGIYGMTDGVSDVQFEDAIGQAKAEGNLSRANLVRKTRQPRTRQAASKEQVPNPGDRSSEAGARRLELIRGWAAQGCSSRQMADLLGKRDDAVRQLAREHGIEIPADQVVGRTRRLDSNRIVRETVHALEGLAMGAGLVMPGELDTAEIPAWTASITDSIRALNRLVKTMKEITR
jgi:hypothetical protein